MTPERQRLVEARAAITWPTATSGRFAAWQEYWAAERVFAAHMLRIRTHASRRHRARRKS